MDTLLHVGGSNALVAVLLAMPAAAVSRWGRRPALAHGLWLLVLLKLLTPPIVSLPLPTFGAAESVASSGRTSILPTEAAGSESCPTPSPVLEATVAPAPESDAQDIPPEVLDAPLASSEHTALAIVSAPDPIPGARSESAWGGACFAVCAAWLIGSAAWLSLVVWRVRQFQQLLRHAEAAPADLDARSQELAGRLGLRSSPTVLLVPGAVAPMLWGVFRSVRLLLPADLLERLDGTQRDTLLVHELAHLRRRDHWVRILELLTTGLFWWHPVVWWARRELREAEEQCCDAWVVWSLPDAAKSYALALVETVDFLAGARRALPPVASGIGPTRLLQRRLTMIMRDSPPRALSVGGVLAVFGLGTLLLPFVPRWTQAEQPDQTPPPAPERRAVDDARRVEEIEKTQQELKRLAGELERRHVETRALEARVQELARRLAELSGGDRVYRFQLRTEPAVPPAPVIAVRIPGPAGVRVGAASGTMAMPPAGFPGVDDPAVLHAQLAQREAQVEEAQARLKAAEAKLQRLKKMAGSGAVTSEAVEDASTEFAVQKAQLKARMAELQEINARIGLARKQPPEGRKVLVISAAPAPMPPSVVTPKVPGTDNDQRLREVERQMSDLVKALEALRKELRRPDLPPTPPAKGDPKPR